MVRMLSRVQARWCRVCGGPPGPDCPVWVRSKRQQRRREKRQLRREAADAVAERRAGA